VEALRQDPEMLLNRADGSPVLQAKTKRAKASIRMMQITPGQATMKPEKGPELFWARDNPGPI